MAPENATTLVLFGSVASFLGVTAAWVWHDATRRRAGKPAFAALLAMMQGPLWLAFYLSDRPLCVDERREGGFAWNMARHFAIAWSIANLPIVVIVLGLVAMSPRARSAPEAWSVGRPA